MPRSRTKAGEQFADHVRFGRFRRCAGYPRLRGRFPTLDALAQRLLDFQYYWETIATPFQWRFTRQDLARLLQKCRPTLKTAA